MSRAQTLVLALLVMNALLGALCLAVARGERRSPALRDWGVGLLVYALGILTTLLGLVIPRAIALTAGNAFIAMAAIFSVRGVLANTRRHLGRRWVWGAWVATVLVLAWGNFADAHRLLINLVAPTPIAIALFLIGAATLLREPPADAEVAARFLAGAMLYAVSVWVFRIAAMWGQLGAPAVSERLDLTISLFVIAQLVAAVACTLALFWIEVRRMEAALTRVAFSDALTELPNRRAVEARFHEEAGRATRHGQAFAMLLLDIDHFKRVNDEHGHLAGDALIKHVADTLGAAKRREDVLGRLGGEEFVLLLTDPDTQHAMLAADRLRERVESSSLAWDGAPLRAQVSGGLALFPADGADWSALFAAADRRLYESKHAGRNRVTGPALPVAA